MRTTFMSDKILNLYRATTFTAPATVYAGLLTAVTGHEAGTVTETTYGGYARQAITFAAPGAVAGAEQIQASAITFPAKSDAGSVTIIAVGIYDAITAGNLLDIIMLFDGVPLSAVATTADFAAGLFTSPAHGLVSTTLLNRVRVEQFVGDPTIPTPFVEDTDYFVSATGLTTDKFALSLTDGGAVVVVTALGRALVMLVRAVIVNQNDAPTFAANKLALSDD